MCVVVKFAILCIACFMFKTKKILLVVGSARFRFLFIALMNRYVSLLLYCHAYVRCVRICVLGMRKRLPVNTCLYVSIGCCGWGSKVYTSSSLWSNRAVSVHLRLALFIFVVPYELCTGWKFTPPITWVGSQVYVYDDFRLFIHCIMVKMPIRGLHLSLLHPGYECTPITHAHDSFILVYRLLMREVIHLLSSPKF